MSVTYDSVVAPTTAPVQTSPVVWSNLEVGSQQTMTLVFRAQVDVRASSGTYYNRLDAATGTFRLPPKPGLAPLTVEEIPRYDLQITKSDGRASVDEGDLLLYTIAYTNVNEAGLRLTNVVITDTFSPPPPSAEPVGVTGVWEQVETNVFTYFVGDLDAGESGSVQFSLQLSDTIPAAVWVISNTVEIGHEIDEFAFETDIRNNTSTDIDVLRGPDLVVTNLEILPADPVAGKPISFMVTVLNQGKDDTLNAAGQGWFIVELYLKGSSFTPAGPPVDVFDHYGGYWPDISRSPERMSYTCVLGGLAAGNKATCPFDITDIEDADDYEVYVQADVSFDTFIEEPWGHDYGLVQEAVESNNIYSHGVVQVEERGTYLPIIIGNH
jgi:hypothetical protein